jgi:hypothetical protein
MRARTAGLVVLAACVVVVFALVLGDRLNAISRAYAARPSLSVGTERLRESVDALGEKVSAVAAAASAAPPPPVAGGDAGPEPCRLCTVEEYEDELTMDLARCDPAWMARYQASYPLWAYGDPVFRSAVQHVMTRPTFNGLLWLQAANGDAGVRLYEWKPARDATAFRWQQQRGTIAADAQSPAFDASWDDARNRLVRMAAACVSLYFDPSLLDADRWGEHKVLVPRRHAAVPPPHAE